MPRACAAFVVAVCVSVLAAPAAPSTVTAMNEATLVRLSAVVVRGEVESMASVEDARGAIDTWVSIRIEESLKGADRRDRIAVSVPGGTAGDRTSVVFGAPRFRVGEKVLVFATPTKAGDLTVTGLFQGKLEIVGGTRRKARVVPDAGAGAAVVGSQRVVAEDGLDAFLARVRALVRRYPAKGLADGVRSEIPAGANVEVAPSFTQLPLIPLRYFGPDNGVPVSFMLNPAGSPVSPAATTAGFGAARQAWTDVDGASIVVADGGITTKACRTFFDGSVVSHGDPCGQAPPFDPVTCSGVLAFTGVSGFTLETKVVNGVSFLEMTEADTVFNAQTDCFYAGPNAAKNYEEVLSHEMGHGLGMGHSCGDSFTPACVPGTEQDDALMRAIAHGGGRGGTPHADDVDGIRFIYPPAGFVDLQVSDAAVVPGETQALKADFNGTATVDFYLALVYPGGFFVSIAPGFPVNTLVPAATNVPLSFVRDVPLVSYTWTGTEPAGSYTWVAILARAGTNPSQAANRVGADVASFTFTP
jgi:hypothetical protein